MLSAKDFKKDLINYGKGLQQTFEASKAGLDLSLNASRQRKTRAQEDFAFFCKTYFPHYVIEAPSVFHLWVFKTLPVALCQKRGHKIAVAAPRGEAKSTLITQLMTLWAIVTDKKHYIVIIMDTWDQSVVMLDAIKRELTINARLRYDFPQVCGQGRLWQEGAIITTNNIKVQVAGSGKKLRGFRFGAKRPDLVILDDIENDENVSSPAQREKLESWLKKTVLPLGPPDGSLDLFYVGTILHYDSVLSRTLANPLWTTQKFQAVISWPDRMDLWDEWETVLLNDGDKKATTFYKTHKPQMEATAKVSWPAMRPLLSLMMQRARDGHEAFDAECQNDPISNENAPFSKLTFWVQDNPEWVFFGACDPSLGKRGKGRDPSAILVGGFDRNKGVLDVIEASIAKRLPDKIIEDIIALQDRYHCATWFIETVQFQEFLRTELIRRALLEGVNLPAKGVLPHTDKILRISSLQPMVCDGRIRFRPDQKTLLSQLRHFPKADHDDGPDCLQMLWQQTVTHGTVQLPRLASKRAFIPQNLYDY